MKKGAVLAGLLLCTPLMAQPTQVPSLLPQRPAPLPQIAPNQCPGFPEGKAFRKDADQFYAARAAAIVGAANRGDRAALATMVSPSFSYIMKQADLFVESRRGPGIQNALDLARELSATRYEVLSDFDMFYELISKCAWNVEMVFTRSSGDMRIKVAFSFTDGLLTRAQGRWMYAVEQDIR